MNSAAGTFRSTFAQATSSIAFEEDDVYAAKDYPNIQSKQQVPTITRTTTCLFQPSEYQPSALSAGSSIGEAVSSPRRPIAKTRHISRKAMELTLISVGEAFRDQMTVCALDLLSSLYRRVSQHDDDTVCYRLKHGATFTATRLATQFAVFIFARSLSTRTGLYYTTRSFTAKSFTDCDSRRQQLEPFHC